MRALSNHPGMQLDDAAAASLERLEAAHGVVPITSAWRPESEQQALINRYDNPQSKYDRPPYLYNPRRPASAGLHVKGIAFDTTWGDALSVRTLLAEYGFMFNYPYDKVHYEYDVRRDKHINDIVPITDKPVLINPTEIDNMYVLIGIAKGGGIDVMSLISGKRTHVKNPYHADLLNRVKNNDGSAGKEMLAAELDIVAGYLAKIK